MSEFKSGDAMRLGIDAGALTPDQDNRACELAERIGRQLATELIKQAANEREAREAMLLTPYVFMYAIRAAIEGAKAVEATGLERMRDGIFKRTHRG
jgi:uncharacterized membrane protein